MARHRPAHAKSGFGRYTPPRRIREAAHAVLPESGIGLKKKAGIVVGTGALLGVGFVGLAAAGSASAVTGFGAAAESVGVGVDCFPAAGTVDSHGNNACASTQSGEALALSSENDGYDQSNNSASAQVIGELGGFAGAFVVNDHAHYNADNSATAVATGAPDTGNLFGEGFPAGHAVAAVSTGEDTTHNYRNVGIAETNAGFAEAEVNNGAVMGECDAVTADVCTGGSYDIGNLAEAISGVGSVAFASAAQPVEGWASHAYYNAAYAIAGTNSFVISDAGGGSDTSGNVSWAYGTGVIGSLVTADAGDADHNHNNTAEAVGNNGLVSAQAGGFKSYEYNNVAQAGAIDGEASANAGDCTTSHCGGSNNTAIAEATAGASTNVNVSGGQSAYGTATGIDASATVNDTDTTDSGMTSAPVAGGSAYAYDSNSNWSVSLNFNGTNSTYANGLNG